MMSSDMVVVVAEVVHFSAPFFSVEFPDQLCLEHIAGILVGLHDLMRLGTGIRQQMVFRFVDSVSQFGFKAFRHHAGDFVDVQSGSDRLRRHRLRQLRASR